MRRSPRPAHLRPRLSVLLTLSLGLFAIPSLPLRADAWRVDVRPVYVDVGGLDQHVLTIREGVSAAGSRVEQEPDRALGYATEVRWERDTWSFGLDFFIHRVDHAAPGSTAAAAPGGETGFEVAGRSFVSTAPDEVLFHRTLEDTTIELWVADLYAIRPLRRGDGWSLELLAGVRNADFDNDYRAVAGIEGIGGTRVDASSNYSRMPGPLLGLAVELQRGRSTLRGELRQSVVFGEAELSRTLRDFEGPSAPFSGPPEEVPEGLAEERLRTTQNVQIAMTDLRVDWSFQVTPRVFVGANLAATGWWGLSVPPGVRPGPGGGDRLEEADLVTVGLGATLGFRF